MRRLGSDRDFAVFFCTQGVSNVGDAAWGVLIPLYVLQLTHNALQVSAVAVVEVAASVLLQVPLSALADRLEGRRVMLAADIGRTLLTLLVPVASLLHWPVLAVVYAIIVPGAALSALFNGASAGAVPRLVPENGRARAYAWQESIESVAWVIGPPLGGLLAVAFGTGRALALDSASYLVSVAGLALIRKRFTPAPDAEPEPLTAAMRAGLRLMAADRVLRRDQVIWALYGVLGSGIVLGLVYVGTHGGRSSGSLTATLAVAAYAAGSAAGTFAAGKFDLDRASPWRAAAGGLIAAAAGAGLIAAGPVATVLAGAAVFGLGEGFLLVIHLTVRARATPEGYFGRITGIAGVIGEAANGLSLAWLGVALRLAHGQVTFIALGAALLVVGIGVAVLPAPALAALGSVAGDQGNGDVGS